MTKKKSSHHKALLLGIFVYKARSLFLDDICDTTFAHECRRSGLKDGTIRKCRFVDDDDDDNCAGDRGS